MLNEEKKFNKKALVIRDVVDLVIKPSSDEFIRVEQAPKSIKFEESGDSLMVHGKGNGNNIVISGGGNIISIGGNSKGKKYSFTNINTTKGVSVITIDGETIVVRGNNIEVRDNEVYVDGKRYSDPGNTDGKSEEAPEDPRVVLLVPEGISVQIENCGEANMEGHFVFSTWIYHGSGQSELHADTIKASGAHLHLTGQSESKIQKLIVSTLVVGVSDQANGNFNNFETATVNISVAETGELTLGSLKSETALISAAGQGEIAINKGENDSSTLTASGQGEITLRGTLERVVASASGQSEIRFSKPLQTPVISTSGQGEVRVLGTVDVLHLKESYKRLVYRIFYFDLKM